ncbi:MAG: 5-(carboxyamino)imidazole ribonucleotide synthase [Glaciecola sp.]
MKVLVLGSGQLAQMMYLAAAPLGVDVMAVDVSNNSVVNPVNKQVYDYDIEAAIEDAAAITVEFEHIPQPLLDLVAQTGKLYPNATAILAGADRVREKRLLTEHDVNNCEHKIVLSLKDLDGITDLLGDKIIFKASRDGYDGYGQWRLHDNNSVSQLSEVFAKLDLVKVPLVAERMSQFDREISVIGARDQNGNIACYEIAENLHYQGQLHVSLAPASNLNDKVKTQAEALFTKIAEGLDYIGVLAVELFQVGDQLLVNEIAPRVHNSGHWTQQGADTCQFEQHMRAVLGFPLGSPKTNSVTAMVNIIGCTSFSRDLISIEGCHLHWYGKTLREKRKMGHINVVANSYQALGHKLSELLQYLPAESFPLLADEAKRLQQLP